MRINNIIIVVSFIVLVIAFWNRNAIPARIDVVPALLEEPDQARTGEGPFEVQYESVEYRVIPEYRYVLHGLVVSYRHHEGNSRMHRLAGDHLNMLDVCVVWGTNADPGLLKKLKFWNGIFTCNVRTKDSEAWRAFDMTALSNNHLISDDPFIRKQVRKLRIGDQVRVEGMLASYGANAGPVRGTSTTREDTGDGACETIYVSRFDIVRPGMNAWRLAMWAALAVLASALVIHFKRPYQPYAAD